MSYNVALFNKANILRKHRSTIWRERKRVETNGKYYVRKAKRYTKSG